MPEYQCALVGLSDVTGGPADSTLAGGRWALTHSRAAALARIPGARVVALIEVILGSHRINGPVDIPAGPCRSA